MYDHLIIGAGIAGLSLAYRIAHRSKTVVIEAESQVGYHSSGRSAAMFVETYGTPAIRALTRVSRDFFLAPPTGFTEHPLVHDRGVLYIARGAQAALLEETLAAFQACDPSIGKISPEVALQKVPCLQADDLAGAIEDPNARDVDVDMLMQGYLKGARRQGAEVQLKTHVTAAQWMTDHWLVSLSDQRQLKARNVVNAAGAWSQHVADVFGAQNIGLEPRRRSAFTFKPVDAETGEVIPEEAFRNWPAVIGVDESFYFKPDAGQLLGSSANADPVPPHDVVAEELDIAIGIDRISQATRLGIRRPAHTWAGLRSFVPDGDLVIGWDQKVSGFFWVAALGGYGIQISPGASLLAANLLFGEALDPLLTQEGITPLSTSPARFEA